MYYWSLAISLLFSAPAFAAPSSYHVLFPSKTALATYIVYLENDPLSKRIANYYAVQHKIDSANLLSIPAPANVSSITAADFNVWYEKVLKKTAVSSNKQFLLTFPQPYRVGCMSITAAFAFGYDESFCSEKTCDLTAKNPYYGSLNNTVLKEKRLYPTMMLAANNFDQAKALIDRGVAAQNNWPQGQAYLVETSDQARSARKVIYPDVKQLDKLLPVNILQTEGIKDKNDILFYFTGAVSVPYLSTLGFEPGAVADHLTSAGGQLTDSSQMSAMRWLEAGATGSYGTVVEPCNHLAKFPDPRMLMYFY
ncbi:MAG: TIGR03790 family protein, partial [Gammaproteobacteria bacterium]|nr:TIGR03790 family protein [Gammaproteobacteria bacterium]